MANINIHYCGGTYKMACLTIMGLPYVSISWVQINVLILVLMKKCERQNTLKCSNQLSCPLMFLCCRRVISCQLQSVMSHPFYECLYVHWTNTQLTTCVKESMSSLTLYNRMKVFMNTSKVWWFFKNMCCEVVVHAVFTMMHDAFHIDPTWYSNCTNTISSFCLVWVLTLYVPVK